jgi:hypothetical protein
MGAVLGYERGSWGGQSRSPLARNTTTNANTNTTTNTNTNTTSSHHHEPTSPISPTPSSSRTLGAKQHARFVLELDVETPGPTALHVACENGCLEVVNELLKLGASSTAQAQSDMTPLHLAAHQVGKTRTRDDDGG